MSPEEREALLIYVRLAKIICVCIFIAVIVNFAHKSLGFDTTALMMLGSIVGILIARG